MKLLLVGTLEENGARAQKEKRGCAPLHRSYHLFFNSSLIQPMSFFITGIKSVFSPIFSVISLSHFMSMELEETFNLTSANKPRISV